MLLAARVQQSNQLLVGILETDPLEIEGKGPKILMYMEGGAEKPLVRHQASHPSRRYCTGVFGTGPYGGCPASALPVLFVGSSAPGTIPGSPSVWTSSVRGREGGCGEACAGVTLVGVIFLFLL